VTAPEFRAALLTLGWSERHLAERLHCDPQRVHRWGQGFYPVPPQIAEWLQNLTDTIKNHPIPAITRDRKFP
jgi:hypothetical protein